MMKPQVSPAPDRSRAGPDNYLSADLSAVLPLESGQVADSSQIDYGEQSSMTDPESGGAWLDRFRDQIAESVRRRDERRKLRAQLAEARQHGLTRRHETRLVRAADTTTETPCSVCGTPVLIYPPEDGDSATCGRCAHNPTAVPDNPRGA